MGAILDRYKGDVAAHPRELKVIDYLGLTSAPKLTITNS